MNILAIFNVVGVLLLLLSGLMVLPAGIAFYYDHPPLPGYMADSQAFVLTLVASFLIGLSLWKVLPSGVEKATRSRRIRNCRFILDIHCIRRCISLLPFRELPRLYRCIL